MDDWAKRYDLLKFFTHATSSELTLPCAHMGWAQYLTLYQGMLGFSESLYTSYNEIHGYSPKWKTLLFTNPLSDDAVWWRRRGIASLCPSSAPPPPRRFARTPTSLIATSCPPLSFHKIQGPLSPWSQNVEGEKRICKRGATRGLPKRSPILVLLSPKHV